MDTVLTPHQTSMIFMTLIVVIVVAQVGLHWWKKTRYRFPGDDWHLTTPLLIRYRSFMTVTLVGLWVIPIGISAWMNFWRCHE